ncbi:MAG: hypothetical protein ACOYMF_16015 [Bacteroidales bacterium]
MNKYLLTSSVWPGQIVLNYNALQFLESYDMSGADLSEKQQTWFLKNLPRELSELKELIDKSQGATLTECTDEIDFEKFWKRYAPLKNSKKKVALSRWNRMTKAEQMKAFKFIGRYEGQMQAWEVKMYAETYLKAELWNN